MHTAGHRGHRCSLGEQYSHGVTARRARSTGDSVAPVKPGHLKSSRQRRGSGLSRARGI